MPQIPTLEILKDKEIFTVYGKKEQSCENDYIQNLAIMIEFTVDNKRLVVNNIM